MPNLGTLASEYVKQNDYNTLKESVEINFNKMKDEVDKRVNKEEFSTVASEYVKMEFLALGNSNAVLEKHQKWLKSHII